MNEQELNDLGLPEFVRETSEIDDLGLPDFIKPEQPNRYAPQMGPAPFKPQAPEEESYLPKSYDEEVKSLNEAYNKIYSQNDLYTAKTADFKNKERLLNNVQKNLSDRAKIRVNDYVQQRLKELKPRTEQERIQMNDQLKREIDNLANKEIQQITDFSKPYEDLYNSAAGDPVVVAMQGSKGFAEGFKKTFQPVQQASQIIESYMPMQAGGLSLARRLYATVTGELPGYQRAATAAGVSNDYDEQLANQYKLKNRINADIARQRGAVIPANWEDQIKQTAVQERIAEVGEAKYQQEKQEFAQAASVKKQQLSEQSEYYLGKAEGVKSGLVQQWGDVKSAGDLYEYITGGVGQTLGLMVPTVAASLVPGVGTALGAAASMGVMYQFEKGIAYKDAIDEIKKRQEELGNPMTEAEIFASPLDKLAGDAATEAGLVNAALEYVGTMAIIGKALPKGLVSDLLGKSLVSKAGKVGSAISRLSKTTGGKIVDVKFRAFVEGLTETSQAFVTNYQKFKAAGYSDDEAYRLASQQDYTEDFVGGLTAGGGIAAATAALTPAEKKANQIETIINNVSDTGNADINQQIDNEVTITAPTGDLGTGQQGAQPEGGRAQTEAGGVLQVSGTTPGAQAEVTPTVTPATMEIRRTQKAPADTQIENKKLEIQKLEKEKESLLKTTGVSQTPLDKIKFLSGEQNNIRTEASRTIVNVVRELNGLPPYTGDLSKLLTALNEADPYYGSSIFAKFNDLKTAVEYVNSLPYAQGVIKEAKQNKTVNTSEIDSRIAKAKEELKTLETPETVKQVPVERVSPTGQPTAVTPTVTPTTPQAEVTPEAKKADIERRRQEELKRFEGRRANSVVKFNPDGENTELTEKEIEEVENLINTAKEKGLSVDRTLRLLQTNGFVQSVNNTASAFKEFLKGRLSGIIDNRVNGEFLNTINAKYDAELAALESPTAVTPTEQDPLTTEGLTELEQLQQVEQPITEQPTVTQPQSVQPTVEQPAQPIGEQPTTAQPVQPEEDIAEEDVILIDNTALLNAGYTNEQIALVVNNPETYAQVDDKIVNTETNEVIKPAGKKKVQPRPKRRPKEKFPKTTFADLEKAMAKPGVKLDELLRIVIGLNNDFSALAEQLLNIYKSNKTVRIAKFDTKRERDESDAWGVYRPYSNTVAVFINDVIKHWNNKAKVGEISPTSVQSEIENSVSRILLHEIVHAYTVLQIRRAIPVTRSVNAEIRALKAYLKHGDNQGIKDIITLYLSAREQTKKLEKEVSKDSVLGEILSKADSTKAYGFKNIKEFLTEAFTRTEFQRLLNRLESPIAPKKTMYQSFVDAVKKILKIAVTGAKELSPVKAGSILESVLRVAPNVMITDQEARIGDMTGEVDMSPAPTDPTTQALIKVAQGLINKGATLENVIQKVKDLVTPKFNIDVDAYAEDILAGVNIKREEVTGEFNADTELNNIVNTPYNEVLTSKKPDNVTVADFKQQQVEALADFLRGKVNSKEQVQDFVLSWNDANPANPISKNIANEAWDRLKTAKREPAATAVVNINDTIRNQAQIRARAKAEGVRETTKQFREKLIKMVQDAIKASNLSRNQINSILAAVKRVNLFTAGSINKLADRIAKLEADAAYADKVNIAKSLRKEIARLAKPKETKVSNYTALARQFLKVDADYLTSFRGDGFTGVDPLDAYIAAATAIKNGFANPKLDKYERIIVSQIQEYANAQIDFKNEEQARELAETADDAQIQKIVAEGMSVDDLQKLIDELQMQERAQELQEELRQLDNPDGILNKLNSVDLSTLDADELALYIHVVDNIIANEDYSMVDRFSNKLLAKERIAELKQSLGSVTKGKLIKGYKGLQQITQMLDAIFNVNKLAAIMYNLSGIYDYIAATARVENRKIAMAKAFSKEIDRIDSRNMGKPQLRLKTEQAKLLMLSELAKYTLDSTEHIEKVHENIQNSIDKWKKEEPKLGEDIQKIYDQYKNIKSAEEAIQAFQTNDPHVYELWKYITTDVFTKELTDEVALNTSSVHNKVFIPFVNYSPSALKTMSIEAAPEEKGRNSAKPVQAGTTKEARRVMNAGQAYDFDDYINDVLYAYTETIHDIETSKHLQLFNNVANNAEFENLIGGPNNRNYIIERVIATDSIERKMGDQVNETVSVLNSIAEGVSQFGVSTALGGIDQIALQYPSAALSSLIMLGGDADLFLAAPTNIKPKVLEAVNKILAKQDIAVRGQAHKYELNNRNFDFKSKSKIMKAFSKIRSGMSFIQKDLLLKPLILSDMSVAQRSFIAFYLKSLRQQGYKKVDISFLTDMEKTNDPARKQALAYASLMLSNLQVASTSAGRSAFIQEPGNLGVLRKVLLPFSSFPINTKIRMMRAFNKMYSSTKKSEGWQEFLAVFSEAATFASIKIYLLPFYYAAIKAGMEAIAGFETPEDDEEDEDINKKERKLRTQLMLEAIPFNVGSAGAWGAQWMVNSLNYGMSETEARTTKEFLKDMGDDPMFERLQNWNKYNEFAGLGQYGIGMQRYADMVNAGMNYFRDDFVTLDNGYGEQIINKDTHDLERMAMMNLLIQALPASPRELRSQMKAIEREQFKMAKERQKESE